MNTMGRILEDWRLTLSTIFAVALIGGVYFFARDAEKPSDVQASPESALLQEMAMKDSTGDGLPDWEKVLYGIPLDATTTDYFNLGMTDGEAVARGLIVPKAIADLPSPPAAAAKNTSINYAAIGLPTPSEGTLTDTFAKDFFALYLSTKQASGSGELTGAQVNALATESMNRFLENLAPATNFKTVADIKVSGTGPDALRAYAAAAETVIAAYIPRPRPAKNQIQYLQEYVNTNDAKILETLRAMAAFYRNAAAGLSVIAVPSEMAATHLALVNALARVGGEILDFSRIDRDPVAAMFALSQHSPTVAELGAAFADVARIFAAENIKLIPGTKGATFVNLIRESSPL